MVASEPALMELSDLMAYVRIADPECWNLDNIWISWDKIIYSHVRLNL
jgi:hypothetical protein